MDLKHYLSVESRRVESALRRCFPRAAVAITTAMRYSLFAGGKRVRPVLLLAAAEVCGGDKIQCLPAACAVEMVHTYSLIHDDLPAMDNDELRRGKPTSHVKFGEATAILAGDALLTEAFFQLARIGNTPRLAPRVVAATAILANESGFRGMIGGQMVDTLESNTWAQQSRRTAEKKLSYIHDHKTGALIRASLVMGAVLSGASLKQQNALNRYGENIGLAFQITDDILDIIGDKKTLGKRGSDRDNNKLTYPALYGLDTARTRARAAVTAAHAALVCFGRDAWMLRDLATYILERQY
jgi:geranylgeranyl diphosphate synthase type II